MKAKVIETGEIIDVKFLRPVIYSRLDCNGKIIEEYNEDELEIIKESTTKLTSIINWIDWSYENLMEVFKDIVTEIGEDDKKRFNINVLVLAKEKNSKTENEKFCGAYKIMATKVEVYLDTHHGNPHVVFWPKNISALSIIKFASMETSLPEELKIKII